MPHLTPTLYVILELQQLINICSFLLHVTSSFLVHLGDSVSASTGLAGVLTTTKHSRMIQIEFQYAVVMSVHAQVPHTTGQTGSAVWKGKQFPNQTSQVFSTINCFDRGAPQFFLFCKVKKKYSANSPWHLSFWQKSNTLEREQIDGEFLHALHRSLYYCHLSISVQNRSFKILQTLSPIYLILSPCYAHIIFTTSHTQHKDI